MQYNKLDIFKMNVSSFFKEYEIQFTITIISILVFAFNIIPSLSLDVLLLDDNARYYDIANNSYNLTGRSFISPYIKYIGHMLMFHSVQIARIYYIIIYMIPVSILFYILNRHYLKLPFGVSFGAAIVINILPNQKQIPVFIDGSSVLFGILFALISFIFCAKYLNHFAPIKYWIVSIIFWYIANNTMGERALFLLPPFLVLIYSAESHLTRKIVSSSAIVLVSILRLFFYIFTNFYDDGLPQNLNAAQPVDLNTTEQVGRFIKSMEWWLPFANNKYTLIFTVIISIIILSGYIISTTTHGIKNNYKNVYILYLSWFLLSGLPFWCMSRYFSVRYFYIPHIALTTLSLLSIYIIIKYIFSDIKFYYIFIILLIPYYGIARHNIFSDHASSYNKRNQTIQNVLKNQYIPDNAQIAMVNFNMSTGGYFIWSSGHLKHSLKMDGVSGIIGPNYNFYNPFNTRHSTYNFKMSGLDTNKPLIAYIRNNIDYKFEKINFFLDWKDEKKINSRWTLYKTNDNNNLEIIGTGSGLLSYKEFIKGRNINYNKILWGDLSDEKAISLLQ